MILVNVPAINGLGKTDGCEKAYKQVLKNLKEIYSNEQNKEIKFREGEIDIDKLDIELTNEKIIENAKDFFKKDFSVFIGGDHSISYPLFNSFSKSHKNPCLIIFDAHADCMHNINPPTYEDWLRTLIEEGFNPNNVILVGLRNVHPIEHEFLNMHKPHLFYCKQLFNNIEEECDSIMEIARKFDNIYLSVDIDVLDATFAPGTAYPEPAGLTTRELIYLLQRIKLLNVKAADIVEVNLDKDVNGITSRAAAKIIAELF